MATLSDYIQGVRDKLHDPNSNFYSNALLTRCVNKARKQVAKVGSCVRLLPPSTGYVVSITVTAGGTGYTTATATISAPDGSGNIVNATASVSLSAGAVSAVAVVIPGAGYAAVPTVTISGNGHGATAMAILSPHLVTVANQETYSWVTAQAIIDAIYPGAGEILGVMGVSVSQGAIKPSLQYVAWSTMQAYMRSVPNGYRNWPLVWSQYAQGAAGSMYLFPIPAQVSQMDWDCFCSVLDLGVSQTIDLIPEPWTDSVEYWATSLAYLNAQRPDDARMMQAEYTRTMLEARAATDLPRVPDPYGMIDMV